MAGKTLAVVVLVLAGGGCASRKQAGDALVVAGTTAVVVGATGGAAYCNQSTCMTASPVATKRSAVIAGAGMASVVAGTLLQESDRYDSVSRLQGGQQLGDPEVLPATYRLPPRAPAAETPAFEVPASEVPASEVPASEAPPAEAAPE